MSNSDLLFIGLSALAILAGVFYFHLRINVLEAKLNLDEEKVQDDQIIKDAHAMPESKLDAKLSEFFGPGDKPDGR